MNAKLIPIQKELDSFRFRVDRASLLSDVFAVCACRISVICDLRTREKRLEELENIEKRYTEDEAAHVLRIADSICSLCAEMSEPQGEFNDWLGELYMNSGTSSGKAGQFFTPYNLSMMTARAAVGDELPDGVITIDEPACGSGGMILAAIDHIRHRGVNYAERVFVHAADLDGRCVRMCYTQLSLAGIPAIIHHRDTLSMKTFDEWSTPAYTFNYLKFRKYGEPSGRTL